MLHVEGVKCGSEIQLQGVPSEEVIYLEERAEDLAVDESTEYGLKKSKVKKAKHLGNIHTLRFVE